MTYSAMHTKRRRTLVLVLSMLAILSLTIAACGEDEDGGGAGSTAEPTTVKLGAIAIPHFAPIVVGERKGFFEEEGIELDIQYAAGGAAIVPAVISGDFDIGYGNSISTILAGEKGLPIKMIAPADVGAPEGTHESGGLLVVRKDSGITDLAQLEGKTIASNTLLNVQTLMAQAAGDKLGADSSTFKFAEIEFPEMYAALARGEVDAIATVEPFYTINGRSSGDYELLASMNQVVHAGLPNDTFFTSEKYLADNPEVASGFARAVRKSLDYANAHREEMRAAVPGFTEITKDLASQIVIPHWSEGPIDVAGIQLFTDLMVKYDFMEGKPSVDELVQDLSAGE